MSPIGIYKANIVKWSRKMLDIGGGVDFFLSDIIPICGNACWFFFMCEMHM